jgi:FKBP-type peptidyl-prolyl cis-trans isomerase
VDGSPALRGVAVVVLAAALVLAACGRPEESTSGEPAGGDECTENQPVTTETGLKYVELSCGDGVEAIRGATVTVDYVGRLEDGKKFDSSIDRGEPFVFALGAGEVIPGWDEGIAGMRVGGMRRLTIPPDLAYGETGYPPVIPPDSTLTFEVDLLEVEEGPGV